MKDLPKHQSTKPTDSLVQVECLGCNNSSQKDEPSLRWLHCHLDPKRLLLIRVKSRELEPSEPGEIFALIDRETSIQQQDVIAFWHHGKPQIARFRLSWGQAILEQTSLLAITNSATNDDDKLDAQGHWPIVFDSNKVQLLGKILAIYQERAGEKTLAKIELDLAAEA